MARAKSKVQQTVGRVIKNHATGREEIRKDKLYSFAVPKFQGWEPPQPKGENNETVRG
jgi:hypothetical protein